MLMVSFLPDTIKKRLSAPLPGWEAQKEMAPAGRTPFIASGRHPEESAVILLLEPSGPEWQIVMIRRSEDGRVHSGQIAFPGGRTEPDDLSLWHTALREAREEIGLDSASVSKLGQLTDLYIPHSNFRVFPFVAATPEGQPFVPDPREVAEIFRIPLPHLLKPENRSVYSYRIPDSSLIEAPCFQFREYTVWGATAMILNEFLYILNHNDLYGSDP